MRRACDDLASMSAKRRRSEAAPPSHAADTAEEANKKLRSALDAVAEEWVCPITQELPLDPVMAEDGRVYERSAIASWLGLSLQQFCAKSPVTNEPMGLRLLPAPQVRNSIKAMVQSGALGGDKAAAWQARLAEEEEVAEKRRAAEGGDGEAAFWLGRWYTCGEKGLEKDAAQAFQWYKRGTALGYASAINGCGRCYALGYGVAKDGTRALMYYAQAAALGSEAGCCNLGFALANGRLGLTKDEAEAREWFEKVPGCAVKDCTEFGRARTVRWLAEHPA